ncbi:uncharacterized protein KQ657_003788 [Scheffersomyces spartinae]|uniref:Cytochrome c oxidase subunit 8, mitochondrial n=1 Tax=Scheffersomyces spartinae TaxID=45513 RepID=A0A9P7VCC6_9ASCO|nr:uncharacterized protein KQ657_003788 [Scheffersomyces spartinae]KAG7195262.1 hypothetical protein KQ657_003788 [Scheffersomyces spartinae]
MFKLSRTTIRSLQSSGRRLNAHLPNPYGTPASGIYSNLPFKVKNRKIPLGFFWYGTLGFFFSFPFLVSWLHMYKAGNLDKGWWIQEEEE